MRRIKLKIRTLHRLKKESGNKPDSLFFILIVDFLFLYPFDPCRPVAYCPAASAALSQKPHSFLPNQVPK